MLVKYLSLTIMVRLIFLACLLEKEEGIQDPSLIFSIDGFRAATDIFCMPSG